jgi:hypothetical protein
MKIIIINLAAAKQTAPTNHQQCYRKQLNGWQQTSLKAQETVTELATALYSALLQGYFALVSYAGKRSGRLFVGHITDTDVKCYEMTFVRKNYNDQIFAFPQKKINTGKKNKL